MIFVAELEKRIPLAAQTSYCAELEELQELLHFPEEVALRLADTEYQLFYQVIVRCIVRINPGGETA